MKTLFSKRIIPEVFKHGTNSATFTTDWHFLMVRFTTILSLEVVDNTVIQSVAHLQCIKYNKKIAWSLTYKPKPDFYIH